jgi:predicted MFS family arabinose efflux permease
MAEHLLYSPITGFKEGCVAIILLAYGVAIAIGSYLGGLITNSIGLIHTSWIGALMVLVAAVLTGFSRAWERKDQVSKIY